MAGRTVEVTRSANKDLDALPSVAGRRVLTALRALADEPRPPGCRKLAGSADSYRLRVGEYRILYEVDDSVGLVTVFVVGHRQQVYRRRR